MAIVMDDLKIWCGFPNLEYFSNDICKACTCIYHVYLNFIGDLSLHLKQPSCLSTIPFWVLNFFFSITKFDSCVHSCIWSMESINSWVFCSITLAMLLCAKKYLCFTPMLLGFLIWILDLLHFKFLCWLNSVFEVFPMASRF